jgi:predicted metalloprotease with PDZ domain
MEEAMTRRRLHGMALAALFCSMTVTAFAANEPLQYELRFERPNTHLMDITIHTGGLEGPAAEFAMPDWAPGSYAIMNYAAEVQGFHAEGPDGKPLAWHKSDAQTWRIDLGDAKSVVLHYQIYGNTLANNEAQYNDRHVFIGGPAVWMYLVGGKDRSVRLAIEPPRGWRVATGMDRVGDNTFTAASYDWFADSPIEISDFQEKTFEVSGTTYHVIVHDVKGRKDFTKFATDTQKIVETLVPVFSPVVGGSRSAPFATYWFLFHIWPKSGGGLEHLNSTQINFSKDWDATEAAGDLGNLYELKLYVTAHEFFHAWNVKRLRPRPLGPFDYSRDVHTPSLWISEGLTSYYGSLALVRAGLITPEEYLDQIGKLITRFEQEPGRKERSIEDTSWDTWFGRLKNDNNLANNWYSYYDGGQIVGHLLDFAIRQNTKNAKSLDDWMRLLYERFALPKPGFEPEDAVHAASEVAGTDLTDFFRRYISGKEPLPYETYFAYAGIDVQKKLEPEKPWFGAGIEKSDDGHAKIKNVIPGGPAEAGGLSHDDVIYAVDGKALDEDGFKHAIEGRKPGDTVKITVLRDEELRDFEVRLAANPYATYTLKPVEHPTEVQTAIYKSWLGLK